MYFCIGKIRAMCKGTSVPLFITSMIMIDKEEVIKLAQTHLSSSTHFLVGVKVSADNHIEVCIDDPKGISLDHCVAVSKAIEAGLDREKEDFSLTVTSAGLDQPFKVFPQYLKFINKEVAVVLCDGRKIKATLLEATPQEITLSRLVKKVEHRERFPLLEVKTTKPVI